MLLEFGRVGMCDATMYNLNIG